MNIVIFGAPGSGKGTQSQRIAEEFNLKHISTGDLLREHISKGTPLGKVADSFISRGLLIPDELMIEVLDEIFKENPKQALDGVIFDGFPAPSHRPRPLRSSWTSMARRSMRS